VNASTTNTMQHNSDSVEARAAAASAEQSAAESQVDIRLLTGASELTAASGLLAEVWGLDAASPQLSPGIVIALAYADNYVAGAFKDGRLVAASVGFFYPPQVNALHSHITGVRREDAVAGIGYALKLNQRAWCLARGVTRITWTFDPLVARNAYFNLRKLGGTSTEYLTDHYGDMSDGLNRGQPSDRMLLSWDLRDSRHTRRAAPEPGFAVLSRGPHGPIVDLELPPGTARVRLELPTDIEALRGAQPDLAGEWRAALRTAALALLSDGWQLTDFDRSGYYVAERNPA
jgi:predicted GNAT superfamily acetyltransferase